MSSRILQNIFLRYFLCMYVATHPDEMPGERYVGNPSCHFESDAEVKLARHWTISQTAATILTSFDSDSLHPTLVLSTNLTSFSVVNKHLKFAKNTMISLNPFSFLCYANVWSPNFGPRHQKHLCNWNVFASKPWCCWSLFISYQKLVHHTKRQGLSDKGTGLKVRNRAMSMKL